MGCDHENVDFEWIYEDGKLVSRKAKCADCGALL